MQAAQDLVLDKVEVGLLQMRLAADLHLAQLGLEVAVALDKGSRLLLQRQRLIPRLKTGGIETVELRRASTKPNIHLSNSANSGPP